MVWKRVQNRNISNLRLSILILQQNEQLNILGFLLWMQQ